MPDVDITRGYIPGSIGRIIELHGTYYNEYWGFGLFFESKVASELAEFIGRYDKRRDGFWTASLESRIEGSIAIDGIQAKGEGAHLRWFIMSDIDIWTEDSFGIPNFCTVDRTCSTVHGHVG